MVQYISNTFQQPDLDDFNDLDQREACFPSSRRFKACNAETGKMQRVNRTHYLPHLYVARDLLAQRLEVWQERYKLSLVKKPSQVYYPFNVEITERMGADVKRRIETESQSLGHEFRDPDLVTYDPQTKACQFIEIKRADTGDVLSDEQKNSLELLERVVPNSTSIVLTLAPR